jgi:cell division protease FtsH
MDEKNNISQDTNEIKDQKDKKTPKDPNKPNVKFNIYWLYAIIAVVFIGIQFLNTSVQPVLSNWAKIKTLLINNEVKRVVVINEKNVEIYIKPEFLSKHKEISQKEVGGNVNKGPHYVFQIGSVEVFENQMNEVQNTFLQDQKISVEYEERGDFFRDNIGWVLPLLIMIAIWVFFFRKMSGGGGGGQIFNIGKSKAQMFDKKTDINVNFNDVAGLQEAKVEIVEIVDFLKNPSKYTELGGKIPKGALLVGPPGTGKTLLAKAVAGEAHVPFFSISGSDFVEMFVGVGASRVRDLFKQAKSKAPCIVFIDEIDAVGRARGKNPNMGSNDERENTLNQLLTEMDGFGTNSGVIVLAATNRADILDRALLRAGRFDRQIHVELPDLNERRDIFKVHLKPLKLAAEVDPVFLAKQTPGFSGADIANCCNESALIAAREGKKEIDKQSFLDAVDRIVGGLEKKNKIISPNEKRTIAYHEAGHATASWLLKYANPLIKVTIVPRGKALGAAWYLPEERQITTTEQMLDEMCAILAGRASEEIMFEHISTGALNDLERVSKMANAMVSFYGMNKKIGNISYYDSTGQGEYAFTKPYSEKTAELIDSEVSEMIAEQYKRAKQILADHKDGLSVLAEKLLEKEVIFSEDLETIFGKSKNLKVEDEKLKEATLIEEAPKSVSSEIIKENIETNLS